MRCDALWRITAPLAVLIVTVVAEGRGQSTVDTGVYARYARPGECTQAVLRLRELYWRDKRPDTLVYAPATDTLPTSVVREGRACAARFPVTRVPERDLLGLMQLSLWLRDDRLTRDAVARLLAVGSTKPDVERGWTLYQLILSHLSVRPMRLDAVHRYLAQLDALGTPVSTWRLWAHTAVSRYALSVGDLSSAITEGRAAVAASGPMPRSERIDRVTSLVDAFSALAEAIAVRDGGPAALAVLDSAAADLLPLLGSNESQGSAGDTPLPPGVTRRSGGGGESNAQRRLMQTLDRLRDPYTIIGAQAASIRASRWYPSRADTAPRPRPGAVTLVVSVAANCGGECYPLYASLRRLYATHRARGLQVILLTATAGYFRNRPAPVPADESERIRRYVLDFLELPGALGITETEFSPGPDGRSMRMARSDEPDYFRGRNAVVVGKDGRIRMVTFLAPEYERVVDAIITKAFTQ